MDGYHAISEGPWHSREDAEDFARCEVGVPWKVVKRVDGLWIVLVADEV